MDFTHALREASPFQRVMRHQGGQAKRIAKCQKLHSRIKVMSMLQELCMQDLKAFQHLVTAMAALVARWALDRPLATAFVGQFRRRSISHVEQLSQTLPLPTAFVRRLVSQC